VDRAYVDRYGVQTAPLMMIRRLWLPKQNASFARSPRAIINARDGRLGKVNVNGCWLYEGVEGDMSALLTPLHGERLHLRKLR
jgi:hypothetical protein